MRRSAIYAVMIVFLTGLAATAPTATDQDKGAEQMSLEGGSQGMVSFPHHQHQKSLADCNACHDLFPQEAGAIEKLKAGGALKNRQVMNTRCIKCHRDKKREGAATGPTLCSQCHQRE